MFGISHLFKLNYLLQCFCLFFEERYAIFFEAGTIFFIMKDKPKEKKGSSN